jgi:hypothetical protein
MIEAVLRRPAVNGKGVIQLIPPFEVHGNVAIRQVRASERLRTFADDENMDNDRRSPVVIYENEQAARPGITLTPRSAITAWGGLPIAALGFVFTASDTTAPPTPMGAPTGSCCQNSDHRCSKPNCTQFLRVSH